MRSFPLVHDKEKPVVAVTMSNGKQGQAVVKHLSNSGIFSVRALTRNPLSKKSLELLKFPNVELFQADLLDLDSLTNAFNGAYAIFGNTTPTKGWRLFRGSMVRDYEIAQGRNLIESIKIIRGKGYLKHFIFSSVCKPKDPLLSTPAPGHFSSKWDIEESIKSNDLEQLTTFLRPASYFENFYNKLPGISISKDYFPGVVHPEIKWQTIAVDDIGAWTSAVLRNPKRFLGEAINLAGEEMTGKEMAHIFQTLQSSKNKKIKYSKVPRFVLEIIEHDIALMANWIERSGYGANISYLKDLADEINISMTSFSSWLQQNYIS